MALYVMADLHLSSDGTKSMDRFGPQWKDHMEQIRTNWISRITDADTVIIPGDISWSLQLEDALRDLQFLNALPGEKLLGKGNHDFWWTTVSKMQSFLEEHELTTIRFLYNNAYEFNDCIVCGTRGWFLEEEQQKTVGEVNFQKIINRENIRLCLSLDAAREIQRKHPEKELPILVFLHFPPVWNGFLCQSFLDRFHEYGVRSCYFGHIHGPLLSPRKVTVEGIDFILISADSLNFTPMQIQTD